MSDCRYEFDRRASSGLEGWKPSDMQKLRVRISSPIGWTLDASVARRLSVVTRASLALDRAIKKTPRKPLSLLIEANFTHGMKPRDACFVLPKGPSETR